MLCQTYFCLDMTDKISILLPNWQSNALCCVLLNVKFSLKAYGIRLQRITIGLLVARAATK